MSTHPDLFLVMVMFATSFTGSLIPCGPRSTLEGHSVVSGLLKYALVWFMILMGHTNSDGALGEVVKQATAVTLLYIAILKQSDTMSVPSIALAALVSLLRFIVVRTQDEERRAFWMRMQARAAAALYVSLAMGVVSYLNQRSAFLGSNEFDIVKAMMPRRDCADEVDTLSLIDSLSLRRLARVARAPRSRLPEGLLGVVGSRPSRGPFSPAS